LKASGLRGVIDRILLHSIWGYLIFFSILLLIFQVIFDWSSIPMDFIDNTFVSISQSVKLSLPDGVFTSLISEGVLPGLAGILIFIPQIALLFFFISILEETGYMSRVVFLMDRTLRKFGLGGKSLIPLVSGVACAIPAVMATRNIENWKDRLITILVTPFMTCSARLPVYLILISLVIPSDKIFGISYQSLTLMGLYILGFLLAIFSSTILKAIIKRDSKSYLVLEMPDYRLPLIKNIVLNVYNKTRSFVVEAGKIIFAISILLWIMASSGPGSNYRNADEIIRSQYENVAISDDELQLNIESYKLENSYIGLVGKTIEPVIRPLGYDWKIGIALVTSFAAREVFVGTLSTIYNVGSEDQETIKSRMAKEKKSDGELVFNFPTGISLMLFYALAMQCMSTLAIVRKETNSWKWPIIQLIFMTTLAYFTSLIVYQILI
jgi:ferrous iron transport protein B